MQWNQQKMIAEKKLQKYFCFSKANLFLSMELMNWQSLKFMIIFDFHKCGVVGRYENIKIEIHQNINLQRTHLNMTNIVSGPDTKSSDFSPPANQMLFDFKSK